MMAHGVEHLVVRGPDQSGAARSTRSERPLKQTPAGQLSTGLRPAPAGGGDAVPANSRRTSTPATGSSVETAPLGDAMAADASGAAPVAA
jgi:hypothetical protein